PRALLPSKLIFESLDLRSDHDRWCTRLERDLVRDVRLEALRPRFIPEKEAQAEDSRILRVERSGGQGVQEARDRDGTVDVAEGTVALAPLLEVFGSAGRHRLAEE